MVEIMVGNRPYRATNFRYKRDEKWADVEGFYGAAGWRTVGCVKRIRQVTEMSWQEPVPYGIDPDGQLLIPI